jgi:hypothetical protein
MWTKEARLRLMRPQKGDPVYFRLEDIQRWSKNRRRAPSIPPQTATTAFSRLIEHADILKVRVECALGEDCRGKYCLAVHRVYRRDFLRVPYDALRSIKGGGPVIAGTLYRYQEYLRHGGGRKVR